MKRKRIIITSGLALILISSILSTHYLFKLQNNENTNNQLSTDIIEKGISIKRVNSTTNFDGSITQTFSFSVQPSNSTSDLVKVSVEYIDGSSCLDVVNATVDNDNNTISVTCYNAFSKQIILTVTSLTDESINSKVNIDYLQRWPIATAKYSKDDGGDDYSYPYYIGADYQQSEDYESNPINNFDKGIVDINYLFNFDYGVYSKEKSYTYYGISSDSICTGKLIDLSKTISKEMAEEMINEAKKLFFKMNKEKLSWSKELIWNLIDSNEYKTALYNSMLSYEYEDCYSRILLTFTDFILQYQDEEGNVKDIGCIDNISFIIDITADYSSLATSLTSIDLELDEILF